MKKILLIVLIVFAILSSLTVCNRFGFGSGDGSGGSEKELVNNISADEKNEKKTIVTIKVEETNIYVDNIACSDVDDMKDMISKLESKDNTTKYELINDFAIKSTYDGVKRALYDLENTLSIDIVYND